jgi:hypothetical protein
MIISSRAAAEQALENLWKSRNSLVDFDMDYKYTIWLFNIAMENHHF